ncbi:MAG: hypothetical protein GTN97_01825 [Nitrosopumilaceae archaeon]|nr:hypothetical protein [Nitrosopumilaceae archaeon]NIP09889.1 hypothetical protein [Nitrosopumilaceae archaeon]NIS94660.1 hypothetical protein [Nitrosopumilaceae archaeon]
MSLEEKVKHANENFQELSSDQIIEILKEIQPFFQSQITQDYLSGKFEGISKTPEESEKKKLCSALKAYFDWYLQGL